MKGIDSRTPRGVGAELRSWRPDELNCEIGSFASVWNLLIFDVLTWRNPEVVSEAEY